MDQTVNILVVDDTEQNLVAMDALLSRPDLNLLKARSGVEALELLLKHDIALALLDVNMPEMDGFELAELMRGNARTRAIPIIFMTAALQEPARMFQGYNAGAVDFLHKPFVPEVLSGKVGVFVELYLQKKQLNQKLCELEQALHVNEMFTAVLGHDLRTPLSTVMSGADLIAAVSQQPEVKNVARRMLSSATRMNQMVNQLLAAALARSGKISINPAGANYLEVCRKIVDEFSVTDASRRIDVLPAGDTAGEFDSDRIGQIFSNLIGNALQHGTAGQPVRVDIDGTRPSAVRILVSNAGHISPDKIGGIFNPYQTAQDRASRSKGLGLGLYIVKHFTEAHGGQVTVSSSESDGTTFEVNLPRRF